ncbi:peptidylprolyl isomerase [Paracoccus aurantiacus]|uniref:Peptidylprolyl isomerase n=1 Tax=Paracoccus aurantiacus TaxID=2599412 RepID=A0A5C6SBJ1_9RHOB|nr:peptidylprolyl isomerase [Paracoccus aurantiacus]
MRTKGKSTIVWILMGLLLLGLGGFGVTNFSGSSTEIGSVGETEIDGQTYYNSLDAQISNFSRQTGQRLTMEQARNMGLVDAVRAQLFSTAALAEEARQAGISVGDQAVADAITTAPAFQGPGGFDRAAYGESLRRQGMTEERFERDVRSDLSRTILQAAVVAGVQAPKTQVDQTADWRLEKRDISWVELTPADLAAPVSPASDEILQAWHQANADRFTSPEIRKISYIWLTPEMLADKVQLDDTALRDLYESKSAEYNQPARRLVSRLVYENQDAAAAAKARLDAGEVDFEQLAAERGLSLADTDLGEMTEAQLGSAGAEVFSAADNGVIGPVETDLGPALFSVNAILDPVSVSYEDALPDLRAEAAADRARRLIEDQSAGIEDLLAGGATLEQVADETELELGQIDWSDEVEAAPGEIGGYPSFREHAAAISDRDFPELFELEDGGVFALRLDEIVPPALIPFDQVRDAVAADWAQGEAHRQLVALAEERKLDAVSETIPAIAPVHSDTAADNGSDAGAQSLADQTPANQAAALDWNTETGIMRDGFIETAPPKLVEDAFKLADGETEIVDDGGRVALVRVDRIEPADLGSDIAKDVLSNIEDRLGQSLQMDLYDYFSRAAQAQNGVVLNQPGIAAVESRL